MLRTIWNTLRDGDAKVKGYLISVFVLGLATLALLLGAIFMNSLLLGVMAFLAAVIAIAVMSNMKLTTAKAGNSGRKKKNTATTSAKGEATSGKRKQQPETEPYDAEEEESEDEDMLASMTEEKLNQLFVKYKVKQEHVPVILDLCVSERVKQCPGFAWLDKNNFKLLLIDSKTRLIERDTFFLQKIKVERGISARASLEYPELRDTVLMKKLFTPYLPRYHKKEIGGRSVLFKNLYVLGEDMKFTSGSVRSLLKLLPVRIELSERRMEESSVSAYYKELFTVSFLWKDGIYTLDEFRERLEKILKDMVDADIPYAEFEQNLSEMISDGLLPMEYRDYAYRLREKKNKPQEKEGKKGLFGKKKGK